MTNAAGASPIGLVQSCKRLGSEPFAYLRDVLDRGSTLRELNDLGVGFESLTEATIGALALGQVVPMSNEAISELNTEFGLDSDNRPAGGSDLPSCPEVNLLSSADNPGGVPSRSGRTIGPGPDPSSVVSSRETFDGRAS